MVEVWKGVSMVTTITTAYATIKTDAKLVVRVTLVRLGGNVIKWSATSFPCLCQSVRVGYHVLLTPGETVSLLDMMWIKMIVSTTIRIVVAIEI